LFKTYRDVPGCGLPTPGQEAEDLGRAFQLLKEECAARGLLLQPRLAKVTIVN